MVVGHYRENRPVAEREAGTEIMMRLPKQFLELVSVVKEATRKLYKYLSLEQCKLNL
jgi:hypothetical protein